MARFEFYSAFGKNKGTRTVLTGKDKEQADKLASGELRHCPRCSHILHAAAGSCESCGALFDPASGAVTGMQRMDDRALVSSITSQQELLKKGKRLERIGWPLLIVCGLLAFATYNFGAIGFAVFMTLLALAGVVLLVLGMSKTSAAKAAIKKDVGNNLVRSALEEVFENVNYQISGRLPNEVLRASDMLPFRWDEAEGNDYIQGTYKGLGIAMSDIRLVAIEKSEDADGHETTTRKEVFKGLWLVCDFGRELSADLVLQEKRGSTRLGKRFFNKKSNVEVDNAAFNEKFTILSHNPHEAFYILTPHMMEFIVAADARAGGDTYMRFSRSGKVYIAVHSGRDAFEANLGAGATDLAGMRQRFVAETRYVTDLIDELRLVDTLYRR